MTLGRNYQRLWSATALSNLADGMFQVALPLESYREFRGRDATIEPLLRRHGLT